MVFEFESVIVVDDFIMYVFFCCDKCKILLDLKCVVVELIFLVSKYFFYSFCYGVEVVEGSVCWCELGEFFK